LARGALGPAMNKILPSLLAAAALAGCSAHAAPQPQPDPAKVRTLVASFDRAPTRPMAPASTETVQQVDRMVPTLAKVEPARIDPKIAMKLFD
jgi:hypothetical protein